MEIRRSHDRLISTMGFPIPATGHLYIESGPCFQTKYTNTNSLLPVAYSHGGPTDRRLNIYVRLNINTLSHKHFIIGVLCYNCFTTSSRGFFPSGAKQLTLPNFILFAMLTLPNIWRACCQFSAKPLSKLWSLYFLLADNALRNQYGFHNHRGNKI